VKAFESIREKVQEAASAKYDVGGRDADGGVTLCLEDLFGTRSVGGRAVPRQRSRAREILMISLSLAQR
jgi:hypothetical protein